MPVLEGINITRTQRQHSSVVTVIPIAVRHALGIKAGDFVVFTSHPRTGVVELHKFDPKEVSRGRDKTDSDRKAKGRGA